MNTPGAVHSNVNWDKDIELQEESNMNTTADRFKIENSQRKLFYDWLNSDKTRLDIFNVSIKGKKDFNRKGFYKTLVVNHPELAAVSYSSFSKILNELFGARGNKHSPSKKAIKTAAYKSVDEIIADLQSEITDLKELKRLKRKYGIE
jgi:hypothetical protein